MSDHEKKFKERGRLTSYFNARGSSHFFRRIVLGCDAQYVPLENENGQGGTISSCVRFDSQKELAEHLKKHGNEVTLEDGSKRKFGLFGNSITNQDLSGVDFSGMSIGQTVLAESNLEGANFSNSFLWFTSFQGANLNGANFSGSRLDEVVYFDEASMDGVSMRGVTAKDGRGRSLVDMSKAHLNNVDLEGTSFEMLDLTKAKIENCDFRNMRAQAVSHRGCKASNCHGVDDKFHNTPGFFAYTTLGTRRKPGVSSVQTAAAHQFTTGRF